MCACVCAYCCPCPSEGSYEEQIRVSNRKPLSPRPVVIVLGVHHWLTPLSPCRHVHLTVSKSGRRGASYHFCSLSVLYNIVRENRGADATASVLAMNVGIKAIEMTYSPSVSMFCTIFHRTSAICSTCGSHRSARWAGWLKCFQTPHTPHFCWPLTKTSNQDFHDAC